MTPSTSLFELIQSLTLSEKRYFKVYASRHVIGEENNYIKLFDAIEKQSRKPPGEYDEAKIKEQFKKEKFIHHLPPQKTYLYNMIMKSLESFHSSKDFEITSYLRRAEILYEKGLYRHCEKVVAKGKVMAIEHERFPYVFEFIRWETELMRARSYEGKTIKETEELYSELSDALATYKTNNEYARISTQLSRAISSRGYSRSKKDIDVVNVIFNKKLLQSESSATAYQSKLYYYLCHFLYAYSGDNYKAAYNNVKKLIAVIETKDSIKQENPKPYIAALNNLATCQVMLKKFDEIEETFLKLRAIDPRSVQLKNELQYSTNSMELAMCIASGQFERGLKIIRDTQNLIEEDKAPNARYEMLLHFNSAVINVGTGNYTAANKNINKILNAAGDAIKNVKNDIYCFTQILRLIVHYERGNEFLLDSSIRSTYRYLLKKERLYKFESAILGFIRKSAPSTSTKETTKQFADLKNKLEIISSDPLERNALNYFDIISWLESKIENRSFAQIIREKAKA